MRPTTAMRWSGAYLALPVLFALTSVVGAGSGELTGYASGDLASTGLALYLVGPLLAAMSALRFRTFSRSLRVLRTGRRGLGVVGAAFWPLLLGGPASICAGVVVAARAVPNDGPSLVLLTVFAVTAIACALTGVVCSWALPVAAAVPVAAGAWYAWLAYVPADGGVLLQNLDPTFAACCSQSMQPAADALAGGLALAGAMSLGYLGLLWPRCWAHRRRPVVALSTVVVVVAALGAGTAVVRAFDSAPTLQSVEPRTTELVCRTRSSLEICMWPEQAVRAGEVGAEARATNRVLARWGLAPITAISQRPTDPRGVAVNADRHMTPHDLQYSMADGYVDSVAGCRGSYGRWTTERVVMILIGAGRSQEDLGREVELPAVAAAAARLHRLEHSAGAMRAWFKGDRRSIRCSRPS